MNVLSLFDGISCCRIALERAGIEVRNYYASEIGKNAIKVAQANWPNNIQLGDATKWQEWDIDWSSIDLVTGGFPCQAWSIAGKQLGDRDERGMLFWTMLDVMKKVRQHNPKAQFLIENVKMKKEFEEYITHHTEQALGEVYKILINSALVSAQNRNRYYWTSLPCTQPEDKGIFLKDIIENGFVEKDKSWCALESWSRFPKSTKSAMGRYQKSMMPIVFETTDFNFNQGWRELSVTEVELLQTVPVGYCDSVSEKQAKGLLGNGWTVDIITHLLKCMKHVL